MKAVKVALLFFFCLLVCQMIKPSYHIPPIFESAPPYNPQWESSLDEEVQKILKQPFHYLASGNQAIVFESADGEHVLKLFRYSRTRFLLIQRFKNWFKATPKMDFMTKITKNAQCSAFSSRGCQRRVANCLSSS